MFNISQFLEKFVKLHKNSQLTKEILTDMIQKVSGVKLKDGDLDIKEESVYIKAAPIVRNQIFMHKEKIETILKEHKIFLKIL